MFFKKHLTIYSLSPPSIQIIKYQLMNIKVVFFLIPGKKNASKTIKRQYLWNIFFQFRLCLNGGDSNKT